MKKTIRNFIIILTIFFTVLLFFSLIYKKDTTFRVLDQLLPPSLTGIIRYFAEIGISHKKINNDYNIKFLPETQFAVLDFHKIELSFVQMQNVGYLKVLKKKPFVLDIYNEYVIVVPKAGNFHYQKLNDTILKKNNFKQISSNLDTENVLDIFIDDNEIFVSYVKKINNCLFLYLAKSKIKLDSLNFKNIFESNECMTKIQSGRIQKTKYDNNSYILMGTSADLLKYKNEEDLKPQNDKSIYGKIIAINLKNYEYSIFSKGHRNILGLFSFNNLILSTENGPRGGDEINRIYKDKNYGWPIASDGHKYRKGFNNIDLKKTYIDHSDKNFEQPIFSFIPSVGISEIIKIDNKFTVNWIDNYLVGSLFGKHIYRIRFNKTFDKINYFEKIYIGERIRDLKYSTRHSAVLMALENTGSLGILTKKK